MRKAVRRNELKAWQAIFEKDVAMMERSDIIIANLTPFGGASADAGTLIESSINRPVPTGRSRAKTSPTISKATSTSARPARCWLPPAPW